MKKIGIIMGSDSDLPVVEKAFDVLNEFGVPFEVHVLSAHRTPAEAADFAKNAKANGIAAIIAAAARQKKEPVITADEIMYEATPGEITAMITTVVELRNAWYAIPEAVKPETDEKPGDDDPKNA